MLKLLIPSIRIWLDVDNLDDVGKLEASVKLSATFISFLSKGYFESINCRLELNAALQHSKPVAPIWEADENTGGATFKQLEQEISDSCGDMDLGADELLRRVLKDKENVPIVWVRDPHKCAPLLSFALCP